MYRRHIHRIPLTPFSLRILLLVHFREKIHQFKINQEEILYKMKKNIKKILSGKSKIIVDKTEGVVLHHLCPIWPPQIKNFFHDFTRYRCTFTNSKKNKVFFSKENYNIFFFTFAPYWRNMVPNLKGVVLERVTLVHKTIFINISIYT